MIQFLIKPKAKCSFEVEICSFVCVQTLYSPNENKWFQFDITHTLMHAHILTIFCALAIVGWHKRDGEEFHSIVFVSRFGLCLCVCVVRMISRPQCVSSHIECVCSQCVRRKSCVCVCVCQAILMWWIYQLEMRILSFKCEQFRLHGGIKRGKINSIWALVFKTFYSDIRILFQQKSYH